jgi:excisionase family DNA binding protein
LTAADNAAYTIKVGKDILPMEKPMTSVANQPSHRTWTPNQLAEYLQVNPRTIRRLIQTGELPRPVRIGRQLRWNEAAVQSILASNKTAAKSSAS